jgi:hypothetical protein
VFPEAASVTICENAGVGGGIFLLVSVDVEPLPSFTCVPWQPYRKVVVVLMIGHVIATFGRSFAIYAYWLPLIESSGLILAELNADLLPNVRSALVHVGFPHVYRESLE